MKRTALTLVTAAFLMPASFHCNFASAEDAPVLVQITMSDIPKSLDKYRTNVIGKMISELEIDSLISELPTLFGDEVPNAVTGEINTFLASKNGQFTVFGLSPSASIDEVTEFKKAPFFQMNANLGDATKDFFAKQKKESVNFQIPGFDEAFKEADSDTIWGRKDNQLLVANYVKHMVPALIKPTGHDLDVHINGLGIREVIVKLMSIESEGEEKEKAKIEKLLKSLDRLFVPFSGYIDIKDKHMQSHFAATTTFPFLKGVDLTVCNKLPDATYSVMSVGLDGKILWDDMLLPVLTAVAGMDDKSIQDVMSEANKNLQDMGITAKIDEVISSINGTFVLAQTKAAPFPGFTFAIPRSPAMDQIVTAALKTLNMELEKDGTPTVIMLPDVPMPFNLLSDAQHWILSSDPQVTIEWSAKKDKGWLESPLGKLAQKKNTKETVMLSVSDNVEELKVAQGQLNMVIGFLPLEPKQQQKIMRGFSNLIQNTGLTYETITQKDGQIMSDGVSLIGGNSFPIMVLSAGIVGTAFVTLGKPTEAILEIPEPEEGDPAKPKDL